MTYQLTQGNLLYSTADVLVNPVNCIGVMGKGLAKDFAQTFPEIIPWYKKWSLNPGEISWAFTDNGRIVANVATKKHWKNPSQMGWIEKGVKDLKLICEDLSCDPIIDGLPIESVAVPPLGCGQGGLNKYDVLEVMVEEFNDSPISFWLYNFE